MVLSVYQAVVKLVKQWLRWTSPFNKGQQEASDQYVGKTAKLDGLDRLIQTRDIQEVGDAERDAVQALRAKHGFATTGTGLWGWLMGKQGDKDTIACDDMTINAGGGSGLATLLGLGAIAAAIWYGVGHLNKGEANATATAATPAAPATATIPDTSYDVLFYEAKPDGTLVPIQVDRLPQNMKVIK